MSQYTKNIFTFSCDQGEMYFSFCLYVAVYNYNKASYKVRRDFCIYMGTEDLSIDALFSSEAKEYCKAKYTKLKELLLQQNLIHPDLLVNFHNNKERALCMVKVITHIIFNESGDVTQLKELNDLYWQWLAVFDRYYDLDSEFRKDYHISPKARSMYARNVDVLRIFYSENKVIDNVGQLYETLLSHGCCENSEISEFLYSNTWLRLLNGYATWTPEARQTFWDTFIDDKRSTFFEHSYGILELLEYASMTSQMRKNLEYILARLSELTPLTYHHIVCPDECESDTNGVESEDIVTRGRPKSKLFREYIDANTVDVDGLIEWLRESFKNAPHNPNGHLIYLLAVRKYFSQKPDFASFKKELNYPYTKGTYITRKEWTREDTRRFPADKLREIVIPDFQNRGLN